MGIRFLCPNGHKLNGPSSLRGKPGQCPHCGSRFTIPADEAPAPASTPVPTPAPTEQPVAVSTEAPTSTPGATPGTAPVPLTPEPIVPAPVTMPASEAPAPAPEPVQEIAAIDDWESARPAGQAEPEARKDRPCIAELLSLWTSDGGEVTIECDGGQLFAIHEFSPSLSEGDFAMFATQGGESNTRTIHCVRWSNIVRVSAANCKELPEGW